MQQLELVFFRRLQVLALLAQQFHALSGELEHPRVPVVPLDVEVKLRVFMNYWHSIWGIGGLFSGLWDHSNNYGTRTTNMVEGFHNKLRSFCPNRIPSLTELLRFLGGEISLAKSKVSPLRQGQLAPRSIRADERVRQAEVVPELRRFREFITNIGRPPTTRECKDHPDRLASRLAHS
ncbi:hypothetical protein Q1695_003387 [Nippostrongylus brasiliensis]|nr:hypothetical protein Q1695_003387 [Nippostrongylus brasiliensis]